MALPKNNKLNITKVGEELYLNAQAATSYEKQIQSDLTSIIEDLNKIHRHAKVLKEHKGTKGRWQDLAQSLYKKSEKYKEACTKSKNGIEKKLSAELQAYVLHVVGSVDNLESKIAELEKTIAAMQQEQ